MSERILDHLVDANHLELGEHFGDAKELGLVKDLMRGAMAGDGGRGAEARVRGAAAAQGLAVEAAALPVVAACLPVACTRSAAGARSPPPARMPNRWRRRGQPARRRRHVWQPGASAPGGRSRQQLAASVRP